MTDDPMQTVRDDIAYVRSVAQEGRQAPLLNGPFLVAASVIFGIANLGQWALLTQGWDVSPWAPVWLWVGAGVVFAIALNALIRQASRKPGYSTLANKAVGAAWSAVGYGIFAMWAAFMAVGLISGDWTMMWAMPSLVFAAYGSAWMVAGVMADRAWMKAVAALAYGGAVLLGAFIDNTAIYLVFAVLIVAVALVPGLHLMRQEPAEVA